MRVPPDPTAFGADGVTLVRRLRARGVETVILAGSDTHGIVRGKRIPIADLDRALQRGIALCEAIWALQVDEREPVGAPDGHIGYFPGDGYPDVVAQPDPDTARLVPWHRGTALLLCGFTHRGGTPLPLSPRDVLAAVVAEARARGFEPVVGIELEFYVLRETSASVAAKRPSQLASIEANPSVYGVLVGSRQEAFGQRLRESLEAFDLPVQACNPESGPGQLEHNLRHAPALPAADEALLLKLAVKELAQRDGLLATFMAKPRSDWPGSSCHLHVSLRRGGLDAFHAPEAHDGMSATMRRFAGGLLAAMPELTAIMAPTPNSYRRLTGRSWAATTATWGVDNRSVGVRAVCDGPDGTRLEHRQGGGDVNPYLAVAATLAAGLAGVEDGREPPELFRGDVYALPDGAVEALPGNLGEATDRLEQSALARAWLGRDFVEHYVAMRRAELAVQALAVTDWETSRYLEAL
ncbi:MAG: glutamine synthetase [Solirubrobacterales bacterium]|nr:glutamine synthetase [Solirubrobacterales bacterium]